ncbi:MAG: hypothetical protein HYR90_00880 [Candidatus Andersenbacteria bacterium]|nr:hypothetical protein [Candidatus Andersenbacteria bacterium]MBI3251197.1 hypothetical protein [Candidatus Andersenbacteria bacterium]
MYKLDEYEELKRKYGSYGSWAVWRHNNESDTSVIDEHVEELHSRFIFLGLNVSQSLGSAAWVNFHGGKHARKLKYALNDTKLRGSYITDIFKDLPAPKSSDIVKILADDPSLITQNVEFFKREMADIRVTAESVFVVLGTPTSYISRYFRTYYHHNFSNLKFVNYYHYAYYALTDSTWVEGLWNELGVEARYDHIRGMYTKE